MRILPYRTSQDKIDGAIVTFVDIGGVVEAEAHQQLLVGELNHRVKNILAVVSALAQQIARRSGSMEEFKNGLIGRIQGLARTHQILAAASWSDVPLQGLMEAQLAVFVGAPERITMTGPDVRLKARAANAYSMVIYELATNAMKYGALAEKSGRLEVTWRFETIDAKRCLVLNWREIDGPRVLSPETEGYGTEMIRRVIQYELDGTVEPNYGESGFSARLTIPTDENLA